MGKTEVRPLIVACICGAVGLAFVVASFSTEYWVEADLVSANSNDISYAHHGLFTGTLDRKVIGTVQTFNLYVTCLIGDNVCAWSCLDTAEAREEEVQQLLSTGTAHFLCKSSVSSRRAYIQTAKKIDTGNFMQAGLWISTIAFLSISLLFNAIALGFNIYNVVANPIEFYASTKAVAHYYMIAGCATLLTLIMWAVEYSTYTSNNIAILDTLAGAFQSLSQLQWSYYVLIAAEIEQLIAMALIYYRQYRINRQEAEQIIKGDDRNNDANTFMY